MSAGKIFWVGIAAIILIGIWTMSSEPPKREPANQPVTRTLKEPVVRTFTEADIYFDDETRPYKGMIVQAVNKIAREDPRCKDGLDPGEVTVIKSPSKSKPGKPVFFVMCGTGVKVVNVFFSEEDLAKGETFKAPVHIDQVRAAPALRGLREERCQLPFYGGLLDILGSRRDGAPEWEHHRAFVVQGQERLRPRTGAQHQVPA